MSDELCGVPYADGVSCTLQKGHPHKQWHRNGFRVWMKPKSEYAYMQGNPDHEWRDLAEAFIREQIAPGDVETVKYWMKRLDRRARRQEALDERVRLQTIREHIRNPPVDYIDAPDNEPGPDAARWSPDD